MEKLVRAAGYRDACGQQSEAVYGSQNQFRLPRFALNERLARDESVSVADVTPSGTVIGENNPRTVGFTVAEEELGSLSRLGCFASTEGRLDIQQLDQGRWRWLGIRFVVPKR